MLNDGVLSREVSAAPVAGAHERPVHGAPTLDGVGVRSRTPVTPSLLLSEPRTGVRHEGKNVVRRESRGGSTSAEPDRWGVGHWYQSGHPQDGFLTTRPPPPTVLDYEVNI